MVEDSGTVEGAAVVVVSVTDAMAAVLASTTEARAEVSEVGAVAREGSDRAVTDTVDHLHPGQENVASSVGRVVVAVAVRVIVQADPDALLIVHEAPKAAADSKLHHVFQFCI